MTAFRRGLALLLTVALAAAARRARAQYNYAPPPSYTASTTFAAGGLQICTGKCVLTGAIAYNGASGNVWLMIFDTATTPTSGSQWVWMGPVAAFPSVGSATFPAGGLIVNNGAFIDQSYAGATYNSVGAQTGEATMVTWRTLP